jgi:small-conductance mechanosensitive channel
MNQSEFQPMSIVPLGFTLSAFFVATFVLCLLAALVLPTEGMRMIFEATFPGFVWLTAGSVVIGLFWAVFFGWYIAVLFAPIRNFMYRRFS